MKYRGILKIAKKKLAEYNRDNWNHKIQFFVLSLKILRLKKHIERNHDDISPQQKLIKLLKIRGEVEYRIESESIDLLQKIATEFSEKAESGVLFEDKIKPNKHHVRCHESSMDVEGDSENVSYSGVITNIKTNHGLLRDLDDGKQYLFRFENNEKFKQGSTVVFKKTFINNKIYARNVKSARLSDQAYEKYLSRKKVGYIHQLPNEEADYGKIRLHESGEIVGFRGDAIDGNYFTNLKCIFDVWRTSKGHIAENIRIYRPTSLELEVYSRDPFLRLWIDNEILINRHIYVVNERIVPDEIYKKLEFLFKLDIINVENPRLVYKILCKHNGIISLNWLVQLIKSYDGYGHPELINTIKKDIVCSLSKTGGMLYEFCILCKLNQEQSLVFIKDILNIYRNNSKKIIENLFERLFLLLRGTIGLPVSTEDLLKFSTYFCDRVIEWYNIANYQEVINLLNVLNELRESSTCLYSLIVENIYIWEKCDELKSLCYDWICIHEVIARKKITLKQKPDFVIAKNFKFLKERNLLTKYIALVGSLGKKLERKNYCLIYLIDLEQFVCEKDILNTINEICQALLSNKNKNRSLINETFNIKLGKHNTEDWLRSYMDLLTNHAYNKIGPEKIKLLCHRVLLDFNELRITREMIKANRINSKISFMDTSEPVNIISAEALRIANEILFINNEDSYKQKVVGSVAERIIYLAMSVRQKINFNKIVSTYAYNPLSVLFNNLQCCLFNNAKYSTNCINMVLDENTFFVMIRGYNFKKYIADICCLIIFKCEDLEGKQYLLLDGCIGDYNTLRRLKNNYIENIESALVKFGENQDAKVIINYEIRHDYHKIGRDLIYHLTTKSKIVPKTPWLRKVSKDTSKVIYNNAWSSGGNPLVLPAGNISAIEIC